MEPVRRVGGAESGVIEWTSVWGDRGRSQGEEEEKDSEVGGGERNERDWSDGVYRGRGGNRVWRGC